MYVLLFVYGFLTIIILIFSECFTKLHCYENKLVVTHFSCTIPVVMKMLWKISFTDWLQSYLFAEEVLEDSKALWFSPNGTKLVYATMNDTNVRNVTFWKYGDPGNLDSQYVQEIVFKYPKVSGIIDLSWNF